MRWPNSTLTMTPDSAWSVLLPNIQERLFLCFATFEKIYVIPHLCPCHFLVRLLALHEMICLASSLFAAPCLHHLWYCEIRNINKSPTCTERERVSEICSQRSGTLLLRYITLHNSIEQRLNRCSPNANFYPAHLLSSITFPKTLSIYHVSPQYLLSFDLHSHHYQSGIPTVQQTCLLVVARTRPRCGPLKSAVIVMTVQLSIYHSSRLKHFHFSLVQQ